MACVTLKRPLELDSLHSPNRPPNKRRRCIPINHQNQEKNPVESSSGIFKESPFTPGEIANNLRDELKRLKHRRQLVTTSDPPSPEPMVDGGNTSTSEVVSQVLSKSKINSSTSKEKPIFTLKQMTIICERMCQERTNKVREEYDKILQQKLSEQYDAFVKFVDHQIKQKYNDTPVPSYLS